MNSRFATTKLHHIRIALIIHYSIEHALHLIKWSEATNVGVSKAGGTAQVTGFGNLNECQTGMLLMVSAEATIERTALLNGCLETAGQGTGFIVLTLAQIVGGIR